MTEQEREQVLKMIESGKISPEDGLNLMRTLDQNPVDDEVKVESAGSSAEQGPSPTSSAEAAKPEPEESKFNLDPRIFKIKNTVSRFWQIPLWIGVFITIMSSWGMYTQVISSRYGFWFFCLFLILVFGVLIIVAAIGSRKARWLFVDVKQKPNEKPAHIFLGFPLPLKLAGWFLQNFGQYIPNLKKANMNDVVQVIETGFSGSEPLVVNVDEGKDGEQVKVYIG